MARQVHKLQYTRAELDAILDKANGQPFVIWHDEAAGVYRFFPDEEKKNIWIQAYIDQELTPEIDAYQFAQPITAPAPYTINVVILNDNIPILEGTEGNILNFTFETLDGNGSTIQESVDVYYTFRSPSGTLTATGVYNAGTEVKMNIDKYLSLGKNTISIMVKGRSTGTIKTVVATYTVIKLNISSTFNIAAPIQPNTNFEVTYTIEGDGDKTIEFYIDGNLVANPVVSSLEYIATKRQIIQGLVSGRHTLQLLAKTQVNGYTFKSKLLYYEFIVVGQEMTTTVIAEEFPSTMDVYAGNTRPGLLGEQYVIKVINWAYYSSDPTMFNATIVWRLYNNGVETPIASRNADIVEAENGIPPEPLRFMPTEAGNYHLQALINNVILEGGDYTISIIQNTAGILEATNGLTMKLSGLGRDNSEPDDTRTSWQNRDFSTIFNNQPWNNNSGWINDALVLNGGATAQINNKPFALEISPHTRNGCAFEIDFETFNVNDEDAELVRIGGLGTASLTITTNKALLRSSMGNTIESRFKSDERVKIAFVVFPYRTGTSDAYVKRVFVYVNGVMSGAINYDVADNFTIGSLADTESQIGMINLGNASGDAGIKIYYLRTYDNSITMYEELNNYFIDSGDNINYLVNDNDIYTQGTHIIDVDKLESTITTVKFTGPLNELINQGSGKHKATCALEVISPFNSSINLYCNLAEVGNAGQSTLDKPVPSFHVRLDKIAGNICYDRDGKVYPKNRWAFRQGNVPEKKFRLQANYMDSSGCHNAAFFRMVNEVYPKVQIDGEKVLRIPAEKYAIDNYSSAMETIYGEDPTGNNWKFPYKINICPDSIPCIVVWREDDTKPYKFLGQYVIMEEKKANYANGMHSIYSGLDSKDNPDPFGFNSSKTGVRLWDNEGCHQMEFLRSISPLDLLYDDTDFFNIKEETFELIYPDEDDLTPSEIDAEWQKFYNDVVHPIVTSYNRQEAFNALLYGPNPKLDRWGLAAYYCLAMRNACTDSMVRNMELVTYDGNIWTPKWWDVDMQCGLQQTGECNIVPTSTRDTLAPGYNDRYSFSGRIVVDGQLRSSWLWDGLEGSTQFMQDVQAMDAALYQAGWTYYQMTKVQDEEYIDAWSNALYNESGISKYLNYNDLLSLQGDRTPHRHWFLRTSYDFFDALNVCGEYVSKVISIRTEGNVGTEKVYFTADSTSYFGWGGTTTIYESGIRVEKGEQGVFNIRESFVRQHPFHIYASNKMSEIDLSEIVPYIMGADIDFGGTYDELLGSRLKKLILGIPKNKLNTGVFNISTAATEIQGSETFSRLEYLDIQGMQYFVGMDMSNMKSLKEFYAAGSGLRSFNPGDGSHLIDVELPTTVLSMTMNGCNLTDGNGHCVIKWYETNYTNNIPTSVTLTTVPSTLRTLIFNGMGNDEGAKELIFDWINAVYDEYGDEGLYNLQVICKNVNWYDVDVDDLLLLSKIPSSARNVTGYIKCAGNLTGQDIVNLQEAFGVGVFTDNPGVPLRIDAAGGFVIAAPSEILAGNTYNVSGISFPIAGGGTTVKYILGTFDANDIFVPLNALTGPNGRYYQFTAVINGVSTVLATLQENTGELVTIEHSLSAQSYVIGVRGQTLYSQDTAHITINKRTYPTSIDFDVQHDSGNVIHDVVNNSYYVTSDGVTVTINVESTPEEITGTVLSDVWSISSSISNAFGGIEEPNSLTFYVEHAGSNLLTGTINHTKTYVGGYSVNRSTTFKFKSPSIVLTSIVNSVLQESVYDNNYSENELYSYDNELWGITDLYDLGILDSGSQLVHLAEINEFINLNMSTLDLSNCTQLGINSYLVELEDSTQDYVNILPTANKTLAFEFEEIDMANTHLAGVNLIQNSNVLESITYSGYTENIELIGQSSLTELNIESNAVNTLDNITIINCNNLEEITWI